ncbi:phage regulatory protein/antirepressor Ant [Comamonas sp. B-9]|uniref:phage regulatory protein/antirepressor Ant n=1 Tax=Comamonas sp. B-9 TaxID=1055192 RepID=UPI0003955FFB|nr:phage regulatory protein/antirepressor Ant [Comamonas sp. B-9]
MTNIANINNTPITMTSREIAELVGKNHADVMRDIRNLVEQLTKAELLSCAESTTYIGKDGRSYPQYELDKDTTLTLLLGYDAVARMKVVKRWQELEIKVEQPRVPQSMPEALRLAAEAIEQRDQLALENKFQAEALADAAPKVEALDRFANLDGKHTVRPAAKLLGVVESHLTKWLLIHKWYYRDHSGRLCAYADKISSGYLDTIPVEIKRTEGVQVVQQPVILQKGLAKIAELLAKDGMLRRSAA